MTGAEVETALGDSAYSSRTAVEQAEQVDTDLVVKLPEPPKGKFGPRDFEVSEDGRQPSAPQVTSPPSRDEAWRRSSTPGTPASALFALSAIAAWRARSRTGAASPSPRTSTPAWLVGSARSQRRGVHSSGDASR